MSSKIRVLSDHTINKIAAGEVIENPASVVKELVENSIDASATDICIEIQGGGRQMIRISDNGCGMNADDALLCLERHATSKLREVEDIHTLLTMGFRGEAIPSIASISKFNLLTCQALEENNHTTNGTMVIIDGGKLISCSPAVRSKGTTIEVKSLFFNVPVRKKFLKSPSIDANEILKTVSLMALGHPEIKFQFISDGKNLMTTSPSQGDSLAERLGCRIESVLGADFFQNTLPIEEKTEGILLKGVIGKPSYSRHNRTGQYLFINKRGVTSQTIAYAVKEGFGTSIPTGRFPVFVLHLSISGDLVDVNVHPQKREVRLRQEQLIKELVIKAVRNGISYGHSTFLTDEPIEKFSPFFSGSFISPEAPRFQEIPVTWTFKPKPQFANPPLNPISFSHFEEDKPIKQIPFRELPPETKSISHSSPSLAFSSPKISNLKILGTIQNYILLDGGVNHPFIEKGCRHPLKGGVVLIDQKNAHTRIIFEKLSQGQSTQPIAQQNLLIPHTFELNSYDSELLRNSLSLLNKMGIHLQEFGTHTFLLDAIPQMFGNTQIEILIADIIHNLRSMQNQQSDESILIRDQAKCIAQAASRAAVSMNTRLSPIEAQSLVDQLLDCLLPYHCPFGKPILVQIPMDELAKLFQK